jgi:hypothetical protein
MQNLQGSGATVIKHSKELTSNYQSVTYSFRIEIKAACPEVYFFLRSIFVIKKSLHLLVDNSDKYCKLCQLHNLLFLNSGLEMTDVLDT